MEFHYGFLIHIGSPVIFTFLHENYLKAILGFLFQTSADMAAALHRTLASLIVNVTAVTLVSTCVVPLFASFLSLDPFWDAHYESYESLGKFTICSISPRFAPWCPFPFLPLFLSFFLS